jgi:hypothetical protein
MAQAFDENVRSGTAGSETGASRCGVFRSVDISHRRLRRSLKRWVLFRSS